MIKLITSARFIGEILDDLDLSSSDYIHRFYSWIEYGLGIMTLAKYYKLSSKIVTIDNHRGLLPCNLKFLHSIWSPTGNIGTQGLAHVPVSTSELVGFNHEGYPQSNDNISVDGYHIHSDKEKGKLLVVYRTIPVDDEGYPMVPDNPFVFEALTYYIIYRLALRGVTHPVISFETAFQMWERLYPRAANDVNWMSPAEYEEFTAFWNSPYLGNMVQQMYIS